MAKKIKISKNKILNESTLRKMIREEVESMMQEQQGPLDHVLANMRDLSSLANHQGVDAVLGGSRSGQVGQVMDQETAQRMQALLAPLGINVSINEKGFISAEAQNKNYVMGVRNLPSIVANYGRDRNKLTQELQKYFS